MLRKYCKITTVINGVLFFPIIIIFKYAMELFFFQMVCIFSWKITDQSPLLSSYPAVRSLQPPVCFHEWAPTTVVKVLIS